MRRLLWKELRERRLMLLALVASTSGLFVFGNYHVMLNSANSGWIYLSFFVALLLGAGTYSSELAGGAADFARSRPISWKSMLAAKLMVGVGFVIAATLLMALVFRVVCPVQYLGFVTPAGLAPSMMLAFVIMGSAYLFGLICSVALPTMMGGVAVVVLVWFSCALEALYYGQLKLHPISGWSFYLRFVGSAVATILISRFGLTLPTGWRTARFCAIVLVFALVGVPMNFTVPDPLNRRTQDFGWSLSPTGRYAAFTRLDPVGDGGKLRTKTCLVRVADGRKVEFGHVKGDTPKYSVYESSVYWYKDTAATPVGDLIRVGRMDSSGRLHDASIRAEGDYSAPLRQSPAGRCVMIVPLGSKVVATTVTIVDLAKMRGRHLALGPDVREYWWQSDSEIGYMDRTGLHIVPVPD